MLSIFSCTHWPSEYILWKYIYLVFLLGFQLDFLLPLSCVSALYILIINPLTEIRFAKAFSHSAGCFSFCCFFCCAEVFKSDIVTFVDFCICCVCFQSHIQKIIAKIMSRSFFPFPVFLKTSQLYDFCQDWLLLWGQERWLKKKKWRKRGSKEQCKAQIYMTKNNKTSNISYSFSKDRHMVLHFLIEKM